MLLLILARTWPTKSDIITPTAAYNPELVICFDKQKREHNVII